MLGVFSCRNASRADTLPCSVSLNVLKNSVLPDTTALKKEPSRSVSSRKGALVTSAFSVGYSSAAPSASVMTAATSLYKSIL